jgi:hypothetical protein
VNIGVAVEIASKGQFLERSVELSICVPRVSVQFLLVPSPTSQQWGTFIIRVRP